jgi:hypothetical protein
VGKVAPLQVLLLLRLVAGEVEVRLLLRLVVGEVVALLAILNLGGRHLEGRHLESRLAPPVLVQVVLVVLGFHLRHPKHEVN